MPMDGPEGAHNPKVVVSWNSASFDGSNEVDPLGQYSEQDVCKYNTGALSERKLASASSSTQERGNHRLPDQLLFVGDR